MPQLPAPHAVDVITVPAFYLPLDVEYLDGHLWRLLSSFTYGSVILQRVLEISAGFLTDFASIPRVLWSIMPPTGTYGKAAVVHDFLYRSAAICTRAQADAVLMEAMTELGVGWWTRQVIYRGVRIGGGGKFSAGAVRA